MQNDETRKKFWRTKMQMNFFFDAKQKQELFML